MKTLRFIALFAILALFACQGPQNPEFQKMEDVKIKTVKIGGDFELVLTGNAEFLNPNPMGGTLTAMDLDVAVDGKKVSEVHQNVEVAVPAEGTFRLPLETRIPAKKVFDDFKGTLSSLLKDKKVEYQMTGTATFDVAGVKVNVPVDYKDEQDINISVGGIPINF